MFRRRKPAFEQRIIDAPEPNVEIIFADGKMVTVPSSVYNLVNDAMGKAVHAYKFEQERRWFEPRDNQSEYTQGFYAGRLFEQQRITDFIKEGKK